MMSEWIESIAQYGISMETLETPELALMMKCSGCSRFSKCLKIKNSNPKNNQIDFSLITKILIRIEKTIYLINLKLYKVGFLMSHLPYLKRF